MELVTLIDEDYLLIDVLKEDLENCEDEFEKYEIQEEIDHIKSVIDMQEKQLHQERLAELI